MAYGQSGHLAISFQNSFGTSLTGSSHYIPMISESITENIEQIVENNMYGRLAESPVHEGTHNITGDIRAEAHPIALGVFLAATLGGVTTTSQGSAFDHEFLPVTADWDAHAAVPPISLETNRDAGSSFLYYDMLGNALALEIAHGQLLSTTMGLIGGKFAQMAPSTPSFKSGRPWSWDVASAAYDNQPITDLRRISLTFNNQLAPFHTLSSGKTPHRIKREGPQTLAVDGTILFNDQVLFREFQYQSEKPLTIHFAGETIATSYQSALTIEIPKLRFSEFSPRLSGPGQLEVAFSGKGIFDSTSGYAIRVTLTNTQPGW